MDRITAIKNQLRMKRKPKLTYDKDTLVSSGSTLLNLACTGTSYGGFAKGEYIFFVGDSMSGKTWFTMTCFAEAAQKQSFQDYAFIHDNPEQGANMDVEFYFGAACRERLQEPPSGGPSRTVEEFYINLNKALDQGPCIYVLDSMDALDADSDEEQYEKERKAYEQGKDATGSYGTGKAKANSQRMRRVTRRLKETGSILIVICQTRDNIGFGAQFNPKTRAGGKALRFYAQMEIWTSVAKTITKTVRGKKRQVGVITKLAIKKNRHNGQLHSVEVPIYHSYGIDDIRSCVEYLIEEKQWSKSGSKIKAKELDLIGTDVKLIKEIEEQGLERRLRRIVTKTWNEIVDATRITDRKSRYS